MKKKGIKEEYNMSIFVLIMTCKKNNSYIIMYVELLSLGIESKEDLNAEMLRNGQRQFE